MGHHSCPVLTLGGPGGGLRKDQDFCSPSLPPQPLPLFPRGQVLHHASATHPLLSPCPPGGTDLTRAPLPPASSWGSDLHEADKGRRAYNNGLRWRPGLGGPGLGLEQLTMFNVKRRRGYFNDRPLISAGGEIGRASCRERVSSPV